MSLFKRRAPKYKKITSVKQIKTHLREFILDSQIPDGDSISVELGCSPISDELLEREEEESDTPETTEAAAEENQRQQDRCARKQFIHLVHLG